MKILHIIDSGGLYGAENMLLDLMSEQVKQGLRPLLCSIGSHACGEKEIERHATQQNLEVISLRMRAGLNLYGAYRILRTARYNRVDILHSHGYKGNILAGCVPRAVRKMPLLCTVHGWTSTSAVSKMALYEWLDRRLLRYKDAVVAVNQLMLGDARLMSANIPTDRLHVVNNGITLEPGTTDTSGVLDTIREFCREGFIIGAVGRLSREKGYVYLLESIARLHQGGHRVRLVLAGDGPLKAELQEKAARLNIEDNVLFAGYLKDAGRCLHFFNVFVISSLSEGLPIALLEAMRASVPVVATRVGGIPEVLANGKSGILVLPGNAQKLAEAIAQIKQDPKQAALLAQEAENRVKDHYSSETMAQNYLNIYKQLYQ
ncbi:glycosyltransferase involved in cell wall biosynthesis [Methylohalomonas lacus]|uniref:Glycosyltransferase involved in cell wall biosynthesis n=1 Tax=Methylohalomonas lacus TaxID=398773 RepID=A0AAE3HMX9_9GAMM|nr:glycosyltransferase [Methylohalomonas lacus]MCS3904323.1 glycosyltransferase involved in cell wall biosynthesis [Methylohalomonas lacus]